MQLCYFLVYTIHHAVACTEELCLCIQNVHRMASRMKLDCDVAHLKLSGMYGCVCVSVLSQGGRVVVSVCRSFQP